MQREVYAALESLQSGAAAEKRTAGSDGPRAMPGKLEATAKAASSVVKVSPSTSNSASTNAEPSSSSLPAAHSAVNNPTQSTSRSIPPPRNQQSLHVLSSVPVAFTPRVFPTPARESKAAEEQDWLARNAQFIKAGPGASKSMLQGSHTARCTPACFTPACFHFRPFSGASCAGQELKDKGDSLLSMGDFVGAGHAYTAALAAFPNSASSLPSRLNRLVAWLGSCGWEEASNDGASLLRDPSAELSKEQRRKVCLRSAAALSQLGRYSVAADVLQAASPSEGASAGESEGWEAEWALMTASVRRLAEADALKAQAASAAVAGDLITARSCLDRAISVEPGNVRAVLNACSVALASADTVAASAYLAAAAVLLDKVPTQQGVDGAGVVWLLGGLPPRRSPEFAKLQGEVEVRRLAIAALQVDAPTPVPGIPATGSGPSTTSAL
jgi:tetratricopeptide (TPR) repeat protein